MIEVPIEGRPTEETNSDILVGIDGNAYSIIGVTANVLRKAGASKEYVDAFQKESMGGDYDHLIQSAIAYLDV